MPKVGTTKHEKMIRAETQLNTLKGPDLTRQARSAPTVLIAYTGIIEGLKNKRIQVVFVGADLVSARN